MQSSETKHNRKRFPLPLMILCDFLLTAVCLLTFSYFHHVRPKALVTDPSDLQQAVIPNANPYQDTTAPIAQTSDHAGSTTATSATAVCGTLATDLTTDSALTGTTDGQSTGVTQTLASLSQTATQNGGTLHVTTTSTTTHTTAVTYDLAGWGSKWPTLFAQGDAVLVTPTSYRSHDIVIEIEQRTVNASVAYVADVHIRYIDNLKSAFAKGEYGKNIVDWPLTTARENNAVLAINGDYYGIRDNGIIVRNYTMYRDTARGDIGAIFYDGTMTTATGNAFDLAAAMKNGLYQTMTFGPNLMKNGKALTGLGGSIASANPRTAFGYYEPGHYAFVVADGRQDGYSVGPTLDELSQLFADIGCFDAYNLDGGQSTAMIFQDAVYNRPYNGGRATSDIFYVAEVAK